MSRFESPSPRILTAGVLIGLATGGRTSAGLTAVAWAPGSGGALARARALVPGTHPVQPFTALHSVRARRIALVAAGGELVMDKLPKTPSRLQPPGLIGRLLFGALAALALAQRGGSDSDQLPAAAAVGAGGALVGSLVGARWRGSVKAKGRADLPAALAEDVVVAGLAAAAVAVSS